MKTQKEDGCLGRIKKGTDQTPNLPALWFGLFSLRTVRNKYFLFNIPPPPSLWYFYYSWPNRTRVQVKCIKEAFSRLWENGSRDHKSSGRFHLFILKQGMSRTNFTLLIQKLQENRGYCMAAVSVCFLNLFFFFFSHFILSHCLS